MEHYLFIAAAADDSDLDLLVSAESNEQAVEAWREFHSDWSLDGAVYRVYRLPPVPASTQNYVLDDLMVIEVTKP